MGVGATVGVAVGVAVGAAMTTDKTDVCARSPPTAVMVSGMVPGWTERPVPTAISTDAGGTIARGDHAVTTSDDPPSTERRTGASKPRTGDSDTVTFARCPGSRDTAGKETPTAKSGSASVMVISRTNGETDGSDVTNMAR